MGSTFSKTIKQAIAEQSNDYTRLQKKYADITGASLFPDTTVTLPHKLLTKPLTVTVVIPAYNVSRSIIMCLISIEQSSFNLNHQNLLQVIVVDDGSTDDTWGKIKKSRFSMHLMALRQTHHGQAQALNTGISVAEGDIIISCDADMVLSYYTIEHFVVRHQQLPNVLLTGFRSNTSGNDPRVNPDFVRKNGSHRSPCFIEDERLNFSIPGWPSNMCLASEHFKNLGYGRGLWMPDDGEPWLLPDLVFGALFSLSRSVYLSLGGYDERFVGWGCTDGFLAAKAIAAGQYVVPIYAASGLHISHPPRSGSNQQLEYKKNRARFFRFLRTCQVGNYPNWLSHAKDRIVESFTSQPMRKKFEINQTDSNQQRKEDDLSKIDGLLAIGEYSRALTALVDCNIIKHNNKKRLLRLGKTLIGMERYQEAIDVLKEALVSTDLAPEPTVNLAIAQAANDQFSSARITLNNLSETHPETPDLSYWYHRPAQKHIRQGIKYYNQGFHRVAIRCFEAALIIEPNSKIALRYREKCMSEE